MVYPELSRGSKIQLDLFIHEYQLLCSMTKCGEEKDNEDEAHDHIVEQVVNCCSNLFSHQVKHSATNLQANCSNHLMQPYAQPDYINTDQSRIVSVLDYVDGSHIFTKPESLPPSRQLTCSDNQVTHEQRQQQSNVTHVKTCDTTRPDLPNWQVSSQIHH